MISRLQKTCFTRLTIFIFDFPVGGGGNPVPQFFLELRIMSYELIENIELVLTLIGGAALYILVRRKAEQEEEDRWKNKKKCERYN